ncbi:MAG TPA: shikimate dehydrogenase [Gemmatimonadaceae bacterium]|nr:shikimate dehydrogenase [Gemmatimonadaceae bacterium]
MPGRIVLLGHPLGHSLSPLIQNAAIRAAGLDATYVACDVPRSALDRTLDELRRERAAGNVTVPYKELVLARCDRSTDAARAVGAVNTFWTAIDGARVGDNTDVGGFQAAAHSLIGEPKAGESVAVLGAGGGAAAVLFAMKGWPRVSVRLYSRTRSRAENLVQRIGLDAEVAHTVDAAVAGATLLVNATPVGLRDETTAVDVALLEPSCAVLDLAYRTGETALVRNAKARGLRAMDGLLMLVEQGALAFERWFGIEPDRHAMWKAISARR